MRKTTFGIIACLLGFTAFAQEPDYLSEVDSIENSFKYEHGTISLKNGVGSIVIPQGFKYLNAAQAEHVIVDLWGNPKTDGLTLGLILPEGQGVLSENGYVFNVQYDEIGYVKDDDADDIDYEELLTQMREDVKEENKEREKEGYEPVAVVGWAAKPYYDKDRKILHWAKEIKFGKEEVNTLNYNVRVLGRKGVLILNAIATKPNLPLVQKDIHKVLNIVKFNDGYQYKDFDPGVDEVAAWTIGGLVAGKVLAKVGVFAIIAKFGKIIVLGLLGLFAGFKKKIRGWFGKKNDDEDGLVTEVAELPAPQGEITEE
jgi:uncharacterized membrane-anchored protein